MSRLNVQDIENAPAQAQPRLRQYLKTSPTGKVLNLHGAMAYAPIVLEMYARMRQTIEEFGELDGRAQWAAMLAVATVNRSEYSATLYAALGRQHGLTEKQIQDIRAGERTGDEALDAIVALAHEAAASNGRITPQTWNDALAAGWSDKQLGEFFAYFGLALFIDYFVNYSAVENDLRMPVEA